MTINLIPPKLKLQKELNNISSQIIFGLTVILILLGIMSLALFLYNASLERDIAKNQSGLEEQGKRLKDYKNTESLIRATNQKLTKIGEIQKVRVLWSEIMAKIAAFSPKNVQTRTINLNQETNNVSISGVALTRKDIALFKEKLEENDFKNVTFSSSTYNQSTNDYTFSLSMELGVKK